MDEKDFVEKIVPEHDVVVVQYESFSGRVIILRPTDYDEGWGREIILEDSEWSITISYEDGSGVEERIHLPEPVYEALRSAILNL